MASHWVCKADGRIQCQNAPEIPLGVMHRQLATVIGEVNILSEKKISVITIKMCGVPAGTMNAYEITEEGYYLLHHGIVGPMGFRDCPGDGGHALAGVTDQDGADGNLAAAIALTGITSAHSIPSFVRDLIGRPVRVYEQGSPVTLDLVFDRVNIVTKHGHIADIWFG